ncbi:hypothetical protein BDY19DRAFT_993672 [Irpex rosettiformis]|uniref:Uncharacterized protein n=1 Tax=Irpex rosettiformis TaxID=378272 RepID=A0ACB8U3C3_9APHY|nr:hypothetical protein BDY19DRAFT_993672 [Irpex rosettiformis]
MSGFQLLDSQYHEQQQDPVGRERVSGISRLGNRFLVLPPLLPPPEPQWSWDSSVQIAPLINPSSTYQGHVVPGVRVWIEEHHRRELQVVGAQPGEDDQTLRRPSIFFRSKGQLGFPLRDSICRKYDMLDNRDTPVVEIAPGVRSLALYRETTKRKIGYEKQEIRIHGAGVHRKTKIAPPVRTNEELLNALTCRIFEEYWFKTTSCSILTNGVAINRLQRKVTFLDGKEQKIRVEDLVLIALEHTPGRDSSEWIPVVSWNPQGS